MTSPWSDSQSAYLRQGIHFVDSLGELNARIGTLAQALHADLSSESVVEHILARTHPFFVRQAALASSALGMNERRVAREWEELRGLLALRCELMAKALAEMGLEATRELAEMVQSRRDLEGIRPDADGFHLRHLLASARKS